MQTCPDGDRHAEEMRRETERKRHADDAYYDEWRWGKGDPERAWERAYDDE